jgi:hypothetical protein
MTTIAPRRAPTGTRELWRLSLLFVGCAVCFFPLIMNPLIIDYFDAESEAVRLEHVEANLGALRLVFTGIGITELALGVAVWIWGRQVAERTTGRRGDVANAFAWVGLAGGSIALLTRLSAWIDDAEELASDDLSVFDIATGLVGWGGFSVSFLVFGYLMIRGAMPRWLGVVWIICGVLFWLGILPLWFFVGALVFGIRGLIAFRAGSSTAAEISASPTS